MCADVWEDVHMVEHLRLVKYRRPIALALSISATVCAVLALADSLEWTDIPGGEFFMLATTLLLTATWLFRDVSSRWRTPKITKTKR
ncbi:hypothetical protein ASE01_17320 [Nocardioides sp. Root190]|nr:hypothetical protein ASE01_17320 [Nocardioides sp. Root190]